MDGCIAKAPLTGIENAGANSTNRAKLGTLDPAPYLPAGSSDIVHDAADLIVRFRRGYRTTVPAPPTF